MDLKNQGMWEGQAWGPLLSRHWVGGPWRRGSAVRFGTAFRASHPCTPRVQSDSRKWVSDVELGPSQSGKAEREQIPTADEQSLGVPM